MKVVPRTSFALFVASFLFVQSAAAQLTTSAQAVKWTALRGVTVTSTTIKKTAPTNWESGSALSVQKIGADGLARFYFKNGRGIVGLSTYTGTPGYNNISNGFEFLDYKRVVVIENGNWRKELGTYSTSALFQVERRSGYFNYTVNGKLVYSSPAANALPLAMALVFRNKGSYISSPRMAIIPSVVQPTATPIQTVPPTATSIQTVLPTATKTPLPTATMTPTRTSTFTPTSTPVVWPTSTSTPLPTRTPTPVPTQVVNAKYVATNGVDTNTGTLGSPYRTIQRALDVSPRGTTIFVRAGTYNQALAIRTGGLTLQSYPGEKAYISVPTSGGADVALRVFKEADHVTLRNLDISGGTYYALKTESNWDSGEYPEYGASFLLIEDCVIHHSGNATVKLTPGSDNITFRRTEIYDSGVNGAESSECIDAVNADDFVLQDSHLHHSGGDCVYIKGGSRRTIIERNLVEDCGSHGIMLGQDTDWEWFDEAVNPDRYENIDGIVRNNIVKNTKGAGLAAQAALRPAFFNNTLVNVAQTMWGAIAISGVDHYAPDAVVPLASRDVTAVNNIVVHSGTRPAVIVREFGGGLSSGLVMNNNRYYSTGGAAQFWYEPHGFYGGFAQWKSHTATDTASTEGAPGIDASERLVTGSACIDRGMTSNRVPDDFEQKLRPRGVAYDIGAIEK